MKTFLDARRFVVTSSLVASGSLIGFFLLGPQLNFPLEAAQAKHLIQLAVPPFVGYVVTAVKVVTGGDNESTTLAGALPPLTALLLRGVLALYLLVILAALLAFYLANSTSLDQHSAARFAFDDLSWAICVALTIQAATFGVLTTYVFGKDTKPVSLGTAAGERQ